MRAVLAVALCGLFLVAIADPSCSDKAGNPCSWQNSCPTCNRLNIKSLTLHVITGNALAVPSAFFACIFWVQPSTLLGLFWLFHSSRLDFYGSILL